MKNAYCTYHVVLEVDLDVFGLVAAEIEVQLEHSITREIWKIIIMGM